MRRLFTTRIYPAMMAFASTPFRAVVIVAAILFVIGWLMGYLRLLDASLGVELPAWVQVPGIVAVVASGPFRFVRNPISLGGVVLMTGIALWYRSAFGLVFAAAMFLVAHLVAVQVEEPGLE